MLKNLHGVIREIFESKREREEDNELLDALDIEDEVDVPTAYAVLLVELAQADGNFEDKEKGIIISALKELFPNADETPEDLIAEAQYTLDSFRGPESFVHRIKEHYSAEDRQKLYALLDKIVVAKGHEDADEEYLRTKFKALLA